MSTTFSFRGFLEDDVLLSSPAFFSTWDMTTSEERHTGAWIWWLQKFKKENVFAKISPLPGLVWECNHISVFVVLPKPLIKFLSLAILAVSLRCFAKCSFLITLISIRLCLLPIFVSTRLFVFLSQKDFSTYNRCWASNNPAYYLTTVFEPDISKQTVRSWVYYLTEEEQGCYLKVLCVDFWLFSQLSCHVTHWLHISNRYYYNTKYIRTNLILIYFRPFY